MERISIKEYARRMEVSDTAIAKAINTGKIVEGVVRDEKNRPWIIPDIATKEWAKAYNPNYGRKPKSYALLDAAAAQETKEDAQQPTTGSGKSIVELKRLQSEIRIQRDALSLRREKGELVDKKKVYGQLFAMGQELRTNLQVIPDRVIDSILAAADRNEAHGILYNAISEALASMADFTKREIG